MMLKSSGNNFAVIFLAILVLLFVTVIVSGLSSEEEIFSEAEKLVGEMKGEFNLDSDISLRMENVKAGSAKAHRTFFGYNLGLDSGDLGGIESEELAGLIAHELAHLEDYQERNWISLGFFGFRYLISENFKISVERSVDMRVIEKGYGEELIAFKEFKQRTANADDLEMYNRRYLSIEEVEELIGNR